MSWTDTMKATALTALAERTALAARMPVSTPAWSWNAQDVWLERVRQPRARIARSSIVGQSNPRRVGTALRD
jgi:hypothetical protein